MEKKIQADCFDKITPNGGNIRVLELVEKYIYECYRIMNENTAMYMFCGYKTVDFFKQKLEDAGFIIISIIILDLVA